MRKNLFLIAIVALYSGSITAAEIEPVDKEFAEIASETDRETTSVKKTLRNLFGFGFQKSWKKGGIRPVLPPILKNRDLIHRLDKDIESFKEVLQSINLDNMTPTDQAKLKTAVENSDPYLRIANGPRDYYDREIKFYYKPFVLALNRKIHRRGSTYEDDEWYWKQQCNLSAAKRSFWWDVKYYIEKALKTAEEQRELLKNIELKKKKN